MRKNFRKLTTVMLVIAMVVSMTGCGSKSDDSSTTSEKTTTDTTSNDETSTAPEINLYGYDEPVKIKIGVSFPSDYPFRGSETSTDNTWMDLYKDNNIVPEVLYEVDSSQSETKLANAITSGNYPDILAPGSANLVSYAQNGVTADLTEVYEEYASDQLKEYFNADGGTALKSGYVDGKLFGLPSVTNGYDAVCIMFIRQDWLDNLGLEMPTTMEELAKVAYAFSHNDPDGNGTADTYGLALNGMDVFSSMGGIQSFFEGYGAYPGFYNNTFTFIQKDGPVIWGGSLANEMKAGLTQLQAMYKDGSIPKDFTTMDETQIFEELGSGRAGICFAPMWGAWGASCNAIKLDPDTHFTAAPIPDGMGDGSSKAYFSSSVENYYSVSSKCKNPEVLIKLMNLSVAKLIYPENDEEYIKYYGDTTNYSGWKCALTCTFTPLKNVDNFEKISAALETDDMTQLNTEQLDNYTNIKYYLDMVASGTIDYEDTKFQTGLGLYTVFGDPKGGYAAVMKMIKEESITKSAYNTVLTDNMSEKFPTLDKMTQETIIKIITGDDVNTYDSFLKSWESLGGTEVTAEAQAWADINK